MQLPDHKRYFTRAGKVLSEANRLKDWQHKTEREIEHQLSMLGIALGTLFVELSMLFMQQFFFALILGALALGLFARKWY